MPSRRSRDDPHDGKDKIPIESPDSSDIDMEDSQYLDPARRRRSAYDDADHEPIRQPMRDQRRSDRAFEPDDTHGSASSHSPYNGHFIPGSSSYGSQTDTVPPQYQSGFPRDAPYGNKGDFFIPRTGSRRRSPSPRASSFSASQATTAHDRPLSRRQDPPPSPTRERPKSARRSRSEERSSPRSKSRCTNRFALPSERHQHGSDFRLAFLRHPLGETRRRQRIIDEYSSSDDGKQSRGSRRRKK